MLLQVTRSPHATAGCSRLPKVTTGYQDALQSTAGYRLLEIKEFLIMFLFFFQN